MIYSRYGITFIDAFANILAWRGLRNIMFVSPRTLLEMFNSGNTSSQYLTMKMMCFSDIYKQSTFATGDGRANQLPSVYPNDLLSRLKDCNP